jgi:hypothetical protein
VLKLIKDEFKVDSLLFFEGGVDISTVDEPIYQTKFAQENTRFVYWEMHLSYPILSAAKRVAIDVVCYNPDGTVFEVDEILADLGEGTGKHWFSNGYGYDKFGLWNSGEYRVEFFINGKKVAEETFEILRDTLFLNQIKVESLQLYDGGYDAEPSVGSRVYKTEFSRLDTQYIYWEVNLSYPQLTQNKWIRFQYVFFNPDGSVMDSSVYGQELDGGSSSSTHSMGIGFDNIGDWESGEYRIEILVDGSVIAEEKFHILKDNMYLFPTIKVESLQFFEGGVQSPAKENRVYETIFSKESSRFINWEIELTYPTAQKRKHIKVEYEYFMEDGSSLGKDHISGYLEKGWNCSWIAKGKGSPEPGIWETGKYRVEISVDGKFTIDGLFEVQ